MISFGFGEVIGGFLMGWFIDKFNPKRATILNMIIIIVMTGVSLFSISLARFNYLTYTMTFLWGVQDGAVNIHTLQTLGSEFESHGEPFGVFNLMQGISVFIFQII